MREGATGPAGTGSVWVSGRARARRTQRRRGWHAPLAALPGWWWWWGGSSPLLQNRWNNRQLQTSQPASREFNTQLDVLAVRASELVSAAAEDRAVSPLPFRPRLRPSPSGNFAVGVNLFHSGCQTSAVGATLIKSSGNPAIDCIFMQPLPETPDTNRPPPERRAAGPQRREMAAHNRDKPAGGRLKRRRGAFSSAGWRRTADVW